MKTENLPILKIHKLSQAQYDRELAAGNIDETALYLTPDEPVDMSQFVTLDTEQIITGAKTFNTPLGMKIRTSNSGSVVVGQDEESNDTMIRLDRFNGTCRLKLSAPDGTGQVLWEQPEVGAELMVVLGSKQISFPYRSGTLAVTADLEDVESEMAALNTNLRAEIAKKQDAISTETWTFTLEDGSTVTKAVYVG